MGVKFLPFLNFFELSCKVLSLLDIFLQLSQGAITTSLFSHLPFRRLWLFVGWKSQLNWTKTNLALASKPLLFGGLKKILSFLSFLAYGQEGIYLYIRWSSKLISWVVGERTNGFILIQGLEEIDILLISCKIDFKKPILELIRCLFSVW